MYVYYISQRKAIHNLGFQLYAHPLLCNTLPKQNEIFCLVNLLLMGGFFGSAAASDWAVRVTDES